MANLHERLINPQEAHRIQSTTLLSVLRATIWHHAGYAVTHRQNNGEYEMYVREAHIDFLDEQWREQHVLLKEVFLDNPTIRTRLPDGVSVEFYGHTIAWSHDPATGWFPYLYDMAVIPNDRNDVVGDVGESLRLAASLASQLARELTPQD